MFVLYLEIGNEDIFKILHLVSEDFNNVDSRAQLFNAFEKYFMSQDQDCTATGTFYPVVFSVCPIRSTVQAIPYRLYVP